MKDTDHDLLIRLDEKVVSVIDELRLLRDGSQARLSKVEADKLDKSTFESFVKSSFADHEKRIRKAERYYIGAIAIVGFVDFILLVISTLKK